jgi:hypothetical protein
MTAPAKVEKAIPVLVRLLKPALVPGLPLLTAFPRSAQLSGSWSIDGLLDRVNGCGALAGTGHHDITAATPAAGLSL